MRRPASVRVAAQGFSLIEVLVAILIFSIGVLGFVGFRTTATREATEAKVRADASFLADQAISLMWANRTKLSDYAMSSSTAPVPLGAWYTLVQATLPGSNAHPPTVTIGPGPGEVDITMRWRLANSSTVHQYNVKTVVVDP